MKSLRFLAASFCLLWMAAGCQQALAPRMEVVGAMPDFYLVTIACLGMFAPRWGASLVGFAAGTVQGAMAGANLAAYAVSRTVAGFLTGWMGSMDVDRSSLMALLTAALATLVGQLLLMFAAPPPAIVPFLLATIASAIYNGVIAVPVLALLRRILDPPQR